MRVWTVATNTFRESVRDKVLYVLLLFAITSVLGSKAIGWISIGQDIKIVKDFTLGASSIFGALIAIFVGTSLLYKELDKRTLYTILSQPMDRWEFVVGKYLGLALLLGLVVGVMTLVSAGYVLLLGGGVGLTYFLAALLIYAKLLLVTAFAVLLSSLSSPILGAIILFCIYVFGHATGVFVDLPEQFDGTFAKTMLEGLYHVFPNLSHFDIRREAANEVGVSWAYVGFVLAYGAGYTATVLIGAVWAFDRKDV